MKNNIHKKEYVITKAEYDKLTEAYNKCQEDMINRKYTEEDLRKAFNSGVSSGWNAQENKEAINADEYIQSLNKQD